MKNFILCIIIFYSYSLRAQTIIPDSAKNFVGKEVTVCGKVMGTYTAKSDNTLFLNFGHDYPDQVFTAVIFSDDQKKFSENPATLFKDKTVCVKGTVKLYKGKPEIVVTKTEEITVQ